LTNISKRLIISSKSTKHKERRKIMLTQRKELTQEEIADAEKLCQLKQSTLTVEWPFLKTILMAYIDGIGAGMQLSTQESSRRG